MIRNTSLLYSHPFPQIKCLFLCFQESLCFEAIPHCAQVAHPVSHSRDFSWQKSIRIAFPLHILESLPAHTFSRQKQMHTKSACALGIWSAQDVSGFLHTPHRWQNCVQQGRDVLAGLNFLCMHKLSPWHTGTGWSLTDEPLSLHLHCCVEVWLAVSSLWARVMGAAGQERWMERAATAAEGSQDYHSSIRD